MDSITPPKLKKGDLVGVCSPSGTIAHKEDLFRRAVENFERETGLKVLVAPNALAKHYYSAGTVQERVDDFHALIENDDVKAIVFSAGGDTAVDLLPQLDFDLIQKNPKIMAGISDATTLLSPITAKTGLITFLGLELLDFADDDMPYVVDSLERAWFQGEIGKVQANPNWRDFKGTNANYGGWLTIREGTAEGRLVGGNLQSFLQLVGTQYELPFQDSILFFEAYRLPKRQIRKALMQLKLRGVFEQITGLIVGYCVESDEPTVIGNEQPLEEAVLDIVGEYDFPIMQIGEIGHWVENFLQPIGAKAKMDATNLQFETLESVAV